MITPAQRRQLIMLLVVDVLFTLAQAWMGGVTVLGPPPPFGTDGLAVLIYEEGMDRQDLPIEQQMILNGNAPDSAITWLNQNCAQTNGQPRKRILDKDAEASMDEKWVQDALALCKGKPTPQMVASNGRTGFGPEPLSKNTEEFLAKVKPLAIKK